MKKVTLPGLFKRGNIYWYSCQTAGHRTRVSLHTSELDEAVKNARLIRSSPAEKKGETVLGVMEAFIAHKIKEDRFTETTVRAARQSLRDFGNFTATMALEDINPATVQTWFNQKREKASEATAQTHLFRVRSFFKWSKKKLHAINVDPTADIYMGKLKRNARLVFCTREERDKLIDHCPKNRQDLKFVLMCGFYAGLRKGEIVEARPDWFDLKNGLVHVRETDTFRPKDREDRTIPMAEPFVKFMKTMPMDGKYCVQPELEKWQALLRWDFRRPFEEHAEAQGLSHVTPHMMRKTFASLLASAGVSIFKIAVWLGDDVRVVQDHYARLLPEGHEVNKL